MNRPLQLSGLVALSFLAAGLLYLIGDTFAIIGRHIGPDGRVPSAEAFGLTALLLSFREVVAAIKSIWDQQERSDLTSALSNSVPTQAPNPPASPEGEHP